MTSDNTMPGAVSHLGPIDNAASSITSTSLLRTKVFIPRLLTHAISRPRLLTQLNHTLDADLTLVSAPAGSGKTTVLAAWASQTETPVAWLSLDGGDNDPALFWRYAIAALQTVHPTLGENIVLALNTSQLPPIQPLLIALLNQIASLSTRLVLILDDYHVITNRTIHDGIIFLLDHLPPQIRLVLATRADPPLLLSRLRARAQLNELRLDHLRFTPDEMAALLQTRLGVNLPSQDLAALATRTEGWVVGLQMAMLALQGRQDVSEFIQRFSGSHRYILDYLVEEVLEREPQPIQDFLMQTSLLDRLCAPLCAAILGEGRDAVSVAELPSSSDPHLLDHLERQNLFIVPLDDERQWYRYHHLFADLLGARLRQMYPDRIPLLHQRASLWYEANGFFEEAIQHALDAGDATRAASLIQQHRQTMLQSGRTMTLFHWLNSLPPETMQTNPVLGVTYCWLQLLSGQVDGLAARLDIAEHALQRMQTEGGVPVNDPDYARLPAHIAMLRATLTRLQGGFHASLQHSQRAVALAEETGIAERTLAYTQLGHSYRGLGKLAEAASAYRTAVLLARGTENSGSASTALFYLAHLDVLRGHLNEAFGLCSEAMRDDSNFAPVVRMDGMLHIALAEIYLERNSLDEARCHLELGFKLSRAADRHEALIFTYLLRARLMKAQGRLQEAVAALDQAQVMLRRARVPLASKELAAQRVRLWIAQGDTASAARWAEAFIEHQGADGHSTVLRLENATYARVLIALHRRDEAIAYLTHVLAAIEQDSDIGATLEMLILRALASVSSNREAALADLARALRLAEPEGHIRVFVDEGPDLAQPLQAAPKVMGSQQSHQAGYLHRLLREFGTNTGSYEQGADAVSPETPNLVELLSEREIEVLRLVAAGLSNQQIADQLVVTLGTVKTHVHHIIGKLGAQNRTQAIARARELSLL